MNRNYYQVRALLIEINAKSKTEEILDKAVIITLPEREPTEEIFNKIIKL